MKTFSYYAIMEEIDKAEGRDELKETGIYFDNYTDALTFTKSREMKEFTVMAHVRPEGHTELIKKRVINVFENISECVNQMKEDKRIQALNKLTKEEKEILGLI